MRRIRADGTASVRRALRVAVVLATAVAALTAGALPAQSASAETAPQPTAEPTAPASAPAAPPPASVVFDEVWVDGNGTAHRVVVGNGASVPITFFFRVLSASAEAPTPRLALQRRIGSGAWTTLPTRVPVAADGSAIVRTPAYSTTRRTVDVAYRLRSSPSAATTTSSGFAASTSRTFTVTVDDQRRYTGVAATIWRAVRRYCPTTAVRIAHLGLGSAGRYSTGGLLIQVDAGVGRRWNTDASSQRTLGLHECAHERQWLNYGSTWAGHLTMQRTAAGIFVNDRTPAGVRTPYPYVVVTRFDALEHAADCSAQAMHPGGYLGYGGWCNAKELREGRRLLLGKRY